MARTMAPWRRTAKAGLARLVDLILPPSCLITETPVDRQGALAPQAWAGLTFIAPPQCVRCGLPFGYDPGPETPCAACAARPPAYDQARAAIVYDDASRKLVLDVKHGGRADGIATFAGWMATAAGERLAEADRIVPVPLHPARLRARGFNQAALLARALARRAGRPFDPDLLQRRRRTPTQAGKTAKERDRNVAGAFAARRGAARKVRGARVLLVDDVHTTGSTLNACARALRRAGAARIDAVTLARVVRPRDVLT
ncbi:MAG: double zinc ribbon domain-containing protein [Caulobacterales bacterium]|nr:double zinc ribbon domain-containing protein [Caulobacterales bacterium]